MGAMEQPTPSILEDFEPGERAWYLGSNDYLKVFGTVVEIKTDYLILKRDDGEILHVHKAWNPNESQNLLVHSLQKSISVDELRAGDRISKKLITGRPGNVVRLRCVVEEVVPGVKVVTRYYSELGAQTVKTYAEGVESIEYQMAGWEVE